MSNRIAVIGTGYVGLVSAVGLADFGNQVTGVDINPTIVERLTAGRATIYEHGLGDYLERNLSSGRLTFTTDAAAAIHEAEVVFLAVGTPSLPDGSADLSQVFAAVDTLADNLASFTTIVSKSTMPVGTNRRIHERIAQSVDPERFAVVSNPEFLREGSAVQDFFHPDRIIVGLDSSAPHAGRVQATIEDIYRPLYLLQTPFVWTNWETAELCKYASNAFLATKITFMNQMANLSEECGADVHVVAKAMGMDGRISPKFLHPGPGFGGSCFPKDVRALAQTGESYGTKMTLMDEVIRANEDQKHRIADRLKKTFGGTLGGKKIAVLGLAFKAETDDVRESPALAICRDLVHEGAEVSAHDPKGIENFQKAFDEKISYHEDAFSALNGADAFIIATEWNEYRNLDLAKAREVMSGSVILDARNVLEPEKARAHGFSYAGVGR